MDNNYYNNNNGYNSQMQPGPLSPAYNPGGGTPQNKR